MFVGGTGRSGTTINARLIDAHPDFHMIATEIKFIANPGGLCDLVDGWTTLDAFQALLLDRWFDRGPSKGLHKVMSRSTLEDALGPLRDGLGRAPLTAANRFVHDLLDPMAAAAGARSWVEMTPGNARVPATLLRIFPDMKFIHAVRDGRDVASSVVRFSWGPDDLEGALQWWATRLKRGFINTGSLPKDVCLVIQLEDLVARRRESEYARLLAFLGVADDPAMHEFFDSKVSATGAHMGRWRHDIPADLLPAFLATHDEIARNLARRGWPYAPQQALASSATDGG